MGLIHSKMNIFRSTKVKIYIRWQFMTHYKKQLSRLRKQKFEFSLNIWKCGKTPAHLYCFCRGDSFITEICVGFFFPFGRSLYQVNSKFQLRDNISTCTWVIVKLKQIGLSSCLSCVIFYCVFVTFPCGVLGQVWYLIVSIPDLCHLIYFQ